MEQFIGVGALMIVVVMGMVGFLIRVRRDRETPNFQKIPIAPLISYWTITAITLLSALMVLLMGFMYLTHPSGAGDLKPVLIFGLMTVVFAGLSFFLRYHIKGEGYEEYEDRARVIRRGKVTMIYFSAIVNWRTRLDELEIVQDDGQSVLINLNWFRPVYLLTYLRDGQALGFFPAEDAIDQQERLQQLDGLLQQAGAR